MPQPIMPTIGRVVLVRGKDGEIRPGLVSRVWSDICINIDVSPRVFADPEAGFHSSVMYQPVDHEHMGVTTWHWMEHQLQQALKPT